MIEKFEQFLGGEVAVEDEQAEHSSGLGMVLHHLSA